MDSSIPPMGSVTGSFAEPNEEGARVSRQDKFEPPAIDCGSGDPSADEVRLQIDLRLRLDEVAAKEEHQLLAKARREPSKAELIRLARRMYDARRQRDRMMDRKLFGEPAWDMLLALYSMRGQFFGPKGLTHAADIPVTTGQRWQALLMDNGLIERVPPDYEPRKQWISLTEKGRTMMDNYLIRLFYCELPYAQSFAEDAQ